MKYLLILKTSSVTLFKNPTGANLDSENAYTGSQNKVIFKVSYKIIQSQSWSRSRYLDLRIVIVLSKKVIFKVSYKSIRSQSRRSDLRLRGAGAERNIFGSTTLAPSLCWFFFACRPPVLPAGSTPKGLAALRPFSELRSSARSVWCCTKMVTHYLLYGMEIYGTYP